MIKAFAIIAISYNGSSLISLLLESLQKQGAAIDTPATLRKAR